MKYSKLDQKQMPQVIILGVLTLGILGWAGAQMLGGGGSSASASPAQKETPVASATPPAEPATETPDPNAPGTPSGLTGVPGLASTYNPDPFRAPAPKVEKPAPPEAPKPSLRVEPSVSPGPLPNPGGFQPAPAPAAPVKVEPPTPVRPTLAVTGIIDVEDGSDMALVEMGANQRIVQVGDLVDAYKVKKIDMSGLLLVNGKDRYFVGLAAPAPEGGKG